jgi:PEP-CTERM motif
MLRSLSRAMLVSALVAAPAGAQFGGAGPGNTPFDVSTLGGQVHLGNGATASNGLTRIDDQPGTNVVVATPEPASMVLVATGLLGVLGVARRKRKTWLS